jgi:hypothetical protein
MDTWSESELAGVVGDPATDPAVLARIAQTHPRFHDAILANPACYQGLAEWIHAYPPVVQVSETSAAPVLESPGPKSATVSAPRSSFFARLWRERRPLVIAAGATVLGLVVASVGIGVVLGATAPRLPGATDYGSIDQSQVTCTDFFAHEDEYIDASSDGYDLVGPLVAYTVDGVRDFESGAEFVRQYCTDPEGNLQALLAEANYPTCGVFLSLGHDLQIEWLAADLEANGYNKGSMADDEALAIATTACEGTVSDDLFLTGTVAVRDRVAADENELQIDAALSRKITWTTTSTLGYQVSVELGVGGAPLPASQTTHPLNDETMLGSACGFDPTTDIAFAARMLDTNLAATPASVQSQVALNHNRRGAATDNVTSGYIDSGNYCSSEPGTTLNIHHGDSIEPGDDWGIIFFVIIKDYYSPRYPDGASSELANYALVAGRYTGTTLDDPIVSVEPSNGSIPLG